MKLELAAWLISLPVLGWADDAALAKVLAHLHRDSAAKFQYQETRQLELVAAPWQGQGYMLTDSSGNLVKLQLQPSRVIMAIAGERMIYWDAAQNQRHSMALSDGGAAAQQIEIFRAVLQGQTEKLQTTYDFHAEQQAQHWLLRLTPKPEQADAPTLEISGDNDGNQRKIRLQQADAETSDYLIQKTASESTPTDTIAGLLQEATGE